VALLAADRDKLLVRFFDEITTDVEDELESPAAAIGAVTRQIETGELKRHARPSRSGSGVLHSSTDTSSLALLSNSVIVAASLRPLLLGDHIVPQPAARPYPPADQRTITHGQSSLTINVAVG
jgi:hypothetical protein